MPIEQLMWVEKYRPGRLDDLVNQKAIKQRLKLLIEKKGELPHLLFSGPPGSGKTTTALIIAKQMLGEGWADYTLSLNASDERGIDIVRERVKTFARFSDRREGVPFRLVILDECDEMCLHPETTVLVGGLDDLRQATLRELYETHGDQLFDIPTFNTRTRRPENDKGKIVPSGKALLYKITFEDGREVLASSEHPFFVMTNTGVTTLRTRDLFPGVQLADFSDRFLVCYNCNRTFYRECPTGVYERYFCSKECKNVFFGTLSLKRTPEERREIAAKAHAAQRRAGSFRNEAYRRKRAVIARKLITEGRIPDPRSWRKYSKGEGAWVGKKLTTEHKKAISEGGRRFFKEHPEVAKIVAEKLRKSLAREDSGYRALVRSGFFKEASKRAYLASVDYWKKNGFRSKTELRMAGLLEKWNIPYRREQMIFKNDAGHFYPFTVDFLIGERIALFVNGCWWHVCPTCKVKPEYEKQRRNLEKDHRHFTELERLGYKVVVVWEHELRDEKLVQDEVLPKIFQTIGISGGALPRIKHSKVRSTECFGESEVLNISVTKNRNFFLANGILTHNTHDAQTALRRIMEETSSHTRFILICNYSSGIIEPLQSRCAIFRFQRNDEEAVVDCLREIAKKEKVKATGDDAIGAVFEATQGDLRQAINLLQAASVSGELTVENVKAVTGTIVKTRVADIVKLALTGDFDGARTRMVELTRVYGVPERDFLKFANEALSSGDVDDTGKAISILAEYDFRLVQGAQPELQLTAMLAELAALKRKGE